MSAVQRLFSQLLDTYEPLDDGYQSCQLALACRPAGCGAWRKFSGFCAKDPILNNSGRSVLGRINAVFSDHELIERCSRKSRKHTPKSHQDKPAEIVLDESAERPAVPQVAAEQPLR